MKAIYAKIMNIISGYPLNPESVTWEPVALLTVCHSENMTTNARQTEKLSMNFLSEPGVNLLLALDASTSAPTPNITVLIPINVNDTIQSPPRSICVSQNWTSSL